ncbi:hypothetical protein PV328_011093 [Microctonus aethiopoides]|uniref:Uncharacterized protein n=1 Tax=Microctonus aethiopoides TaxID=144406 RepID=A0AA39C4B7_9HYME|nr:hypothetical protein PV328_011093 [Microctonus aethiopoides]
MSILNLIYNKKKLKEDSTKIKVAPFINCHDNIINLWKILFKDAPSVLESQVCSNSLCQTYEQALPAISVNHKIITQQGFTALEKALEFHHKIYNVRCRFRYKGIATRFTVPQQISGVATYISGHYFANCRRLGGNWQIYNDLLIKPKSASVHTDVELHAVLYVLK